MKIAVIGGGIFGVTAAFKLAKNHSVDLFEKNNDITLIASSPETKYQIFRYQNHAYGIQFHIEVQNSKKYMRNALVILKVF